MSTADVTPAAGKHGFFSCGDAPGGIGGGIGIFVWFNDEDSLLNYIGKVLPFTPPGPHGANVDEVEARVLEVLERKHNASTELTFAQVIEQLNPILKGFSQINWMGVYESLIVPVVDDEFRQRLRVDLFESLEISPYDGQLQDQHLEDFNEMLQGYGF
jgi:hypothetical protein